MKKIFLLMIALGLFSCNNNSSVNNQPKTKPIKRQPGYNTPVQDNIKINTFTVIPNDIAGCVCYFYLSKSDEKEEKYVMVENFADQGYISLNGKMEKFKLVNFKDNDYYIYTNGNYTLKIEFKSRTDTGDEAFTMKGILTLSKNGITLIKKDILGEYSC